MGDYKNWYAWEQAHKPAKPAAKNNPYKIGDYAHWYAWEQANRNPSAVVNSGIKNMCNRIINGKFSFLTDEGTLIYREVGTVGISNLSGCLWETTKLNVQLNGTAFCPVPTANGQFFHRKTELNLDVMQSPSSNKAPITWITFLMYPKGTWTPAESSTSSFEAMIQAQNNSLFKIEILDWATIFKGETRSNEAKYYYSYHTTIDLTDKVNRLQNSINRREGLINEEDATPCYLGFCLRDVDAGDSTYWSTSITDVRGLKAVPFKP